jgi:FHA domain
MYVGNSWTLRPTPKAACMIGRSTGKKFKEKGVSLSTDEEVSTTHGKVHVRGGKLYFTDTGSTNGSTVNG